VKSVIASAVLRGCMRLYDAAYDLPEEHWFRSMLFRARFFGKSKSGFPNPKTDFCVFCGKSKNGSWIHKIHIQGGFFESNPNPDFWDSQSQRSFGKGFEKSIFDTRFFEKKKIIRNRCRTCITLQLNLSWWRLINFEPLVTYNSVCHLLKLLVQCF